MQFFYLLILPLFLFSQEMYTRTQALMGTFVHITLPAPYNQQISDSFALIHHIEEELSSYSPHLVYQLNQKHTVPFHARLSEAIRLSKQYYKDTHGYFDITIGSISKNLYHFGEENNSVPSSEALQQAKLNIDAIKINTSSITTEKDITIDLGGMGKGYAVDKVADFLEAQNITQGVIALSGDIRCLDICAFELQSPFSEQTFAKLTSRIPQLSISTSGTYRRYVGTQKNHHLINPKSRSQGRSFVSVSIFTQANNTLCDVMATAIASMPKKEALKFVKNQKRFGYVLITPTGEEISGNLKKFVERIK